MNIRNFIIPCTQCVILWVHTFLVNKMNEIKLGNKMRKKNYVFILNKAKQVFHGNGCAHKQMKTSASTKNVYKNHLRKRDQQIYKIELIVYGGGGSI